MYKHYLKVALRNLLKFKTQSIMSAICLAVGIVVFSQTIFLIQHLSNNYADFPDYKQRIRFTLTPERMSTVPIFSIYDFHKLEEQRIVGIDSLAVHSFKRKAEVNVIDKNQKEQPFIIDYRLVNPFFFSYYNMPFLYGNRLPVKPDEIVISQDFAKKICGDEYPIGMSLHIVNDEEGNATKDFVIVNVIANNRKELNIDADCYFSLENRYGGWFTIDSRLSKMGSLIDLRAQLEKISWMRGDLAVHVDAYSISKKQAESKEFLGQLLLLFVGSLILISGIINFLKFIIHMFYNRQRELSIRKSLGSDTSGMFSLLFAEVLWMMSFALILSFALTEIAIRIIRDYIPQGELPDLSISSVSGIQLAIYAGILLICLLIILFPINKLRNVSFANYFTRNNKRHLFRNIMISIQLGISMFFVGGMLIINISLDELFGKMYNPLDSKDESHIISLSINSKRMEQNMDAIISSINTLPDIIEKISSSYPVKMDSYTTTNYTKADKSTTSVTISAGDPNYFSFFQIPVSGKIVDAKDTENIYISEEFQAMLVKDNVQGQIKLNNKNYNIAGVYKALYKESTNNSKKAGSVFIPASNNSIYYFKVSPSGNVNKSIQKITEICRNYVPDTLPVDIQPLDENKHEFDGTLYMMRNMLIILAIISILLVVLSIYSAISMDTISRQKEVAIRKINGATPNTIAILFGKIYIQIFLLTFIIIYPLLRLIMIKVLGKSGLTSAYDWGWGIILFIIIALLLFLVTGYKIYKIMHANPASIIKSE